MSRRPLLAGNWKMHKTIHQAVDLVKGIVEGTKDLRNREIVVCPPFTALASVYENLKGTSIRMGCQNVHWEESGAFTGEVSPAMARDAGCHYAIVGHSERRHIFGETDKMIHRKMQACVRFGLLPILCVGETLDEREAGQTQEKVTQQVRSALEGISGLDGDRIVVAYEPIWAIGTGKTDSPHEANKTCAVIRAAIGEMLGEAEARTVRILYGGSVKPENIDDFMAQRDIDGALVGGGCLTAPSFLRIIHHHEHQP